MNNHHDNVVIIFAKKPEIGKVKTRIAQETSPQFAYDFTKACLADLLNKISKSGYYDLIVGVDSREDLAWFQKNFSLDGVIIPNVNGRNKQNIQSKKFDKIFSKLLGKRDYNYKKALLIPMDIPFIKEEDLISSFARLDANKYVLGPEINGGIYLIGIRKPYKNNIFSKVRWSTPYSLDDLTKSCGRTNAFFLKLKNDLNLPTDILNLKDEIYHSCPVLYNFLEKNGFYLSLNNRYIDFDNLSICIPVVSNITERRRRGKLEILLQTRHKPSIDPRYINKMEIPSGLIKKYELAQDVAIRETKEETGVITKISSEQLVIETIKQKNGDVVSIYKPFLCCQQLLGGRAYLSIVFVSEYVKGGLSENYNENKNPRWVPINKVKDLIVKHPEKVFSISLVAIREYLRYKKC